MLQNANLEINEKNFFEVYMNNLDKEMKEMGHVNLVIAGKTGVGKSTLINAAFMENVAKTGIGKPITNEGDMKWFEKEGYPLRIYDTVGLELDDEKRNNSIKQIKEQCDTSIKNQDPDKFVHVMWYCVSSDSDRLEQFEADYINEIAEKVHVILVITKTYRKGHSKRLLQSITEEYPDLDVKNKVYLLAQDESIEDCDEGEVPIKAFGVSELIEMTAEILPSAAQKAWCNAQKASIELKCKRAHNYVKAAAAASFGEGYIPLPFSDAAALVPTELAMLASINTAFGIRISKDMLKSIVTSLVGVAGATFVGRTIVSNLLKFVPGVGTAMGGTISGTTASLVTVALGEAYIVVMRKLVEGEIEEQDLDTEEVRNELQELFKDKLKKKNK